MKEKRELINKVLSFTLPFIVLMIMFSLVGIFPFGNSSVTVNDANNQYIAILAYFRENIFHPQNLLYSFKLNLGGQFFSVLTYYLLSPINLLSLLFPISKISLFFELNTIFNACLTSLMMYVFLSRSKYTRQSNNGINIVFSLCFALSSYFFLYNHCEMWFNVIAFFPLLMLFLEELLDGKNSWRFGTLYVVMLLMNYYITFMITVFVVISYFIWAISTKNIKVIINRTRTLVLTGIIAFLLGSVSIIPSYLCQKLVKDQASFQINLHRIYYIKDLFNNLFFNISSAKGQIIGKDGIAFNHYPHVYMTFVITFVLVSFFFSKLIKKRSKLLATLLLGILFLFTWNQTLYFMWHGFTAPHGYPQRGTFIIDFVLVIIVSNYIKHFNEKRESLKVPIIVTLILVGLNYLSVRNITNLIINIIFLLLVVLILIVRKENCIKFLLPLVVIDIIFSNVSVFSKLSEQSTNIEAYAKGYNEMKQTLNKMSKNDKSFYRIGTADEMNPNDPLLYGYNGLSNYVSQQPTQLINFMSTVGYFQRTNPVYRWSSYNNGSTLAMDSLLGIKYYIGNNDSYAENIIKSNNELRSLSSISNGITTANKPQKINNFDVFENKFSFPLAFPVNKGATEKIDFQGLPTNDPFKYQNKVFKDLFGINKLYCNLKLDNRRISRSSSCYTYEVSNSGIVYMYLPEKMFAKLPELSLYVNNKKIGNINSNYDSLNKGEGKNSKNGIISIGKFEKGERLNVKLVYKNHKTQLLSPVLAVENEDVVSQMSKAARTSDVKVKRISGNSIDIETNKEFNSNYLMLTIPYDKGWKITVNGKRETSRMLISTFMGIKLRKGTNKIELHYEVPGIKISVMLFILGVVLLLGNLAVKKRREN